MNDIEDVIQVFCISLSVATFLVNTGRGVKAIEICKECFIYLHYEVLEKEEQLVEVLTIVIYQTMFSACCLLTDYTNAIKYGRELLVIYRECGETVEEGKLTLTLAKIYARQCKYAEARELNEKAIDITKGTGDLEGQAHAYIEFGTMCYRLGEYDKALEHHKKALAITIQTDDRAGKAAAYGNLGVVFQCIGGYVKAKQYLEKALPITIEVGDRAAEAAVYGNLGTVFQLLGEHNKAKEYVKKALAIRIEIGDRAGEATDYRNVGSTFHFLGEIFKGQEYYNKALAISKEIGDRAGEAASYGNLAVLLQSLGQSDKAKRYNEKALAIRIEIGDRVGEANSCGSLGTVFESLGEYDKAKDYFEKALAIRIEIGDREGQASCYGYLGAFFQSRGEYVHAIGYVEKAIAISKEIGHREQETIAYGKLAYLFLSMGEYDKAREYLKKQLTISIEIGHRRGEAEALGNLGVVFQNLGESVKAKEYYDEALAIKVEIGDKGGEGTIYGNLGTMFHDLGEYDKAKEFYEKSLAIMLEIGDRREEAIDNRKLGTLFASLGEYSKAEEHLQKALSISKEIGNSENEFHCYCDLTVVKLCQKKIREAFDYLILSINKSEDLRDLLKDNDQFKIAFSDVRDFPYRNLSAFFCVYGNPTNALYVLELARARALADLMATQYSVERQISADPQSWIGIENTMKKEHNCACLYISYYVKNMFLWILKTSGVIHFRNIKVNENIIGAKLVSSMNEFLAESFRSLVILSQVDCEDRSLNSSESEPKCPQEEKLADLRLVEDDDNENQEPKPSLPLLYKIFIAPVADLLEEPEIIIVPDRALYQVPFAALRDESGKYLSETFRIRLAPSLSTLKLIQDSPADYHSQTGALIVGDPVVGRVRYKGRRKTFLPLPCARKEAEMIGELLGVQPLLGQNATKQAVLKSLHSVSLIHFAAHGDAERGEIALSPLRSTKKIPQEEDYLLTMSDISKVQLRAKLVVLSCCHSGCGQIRAEGVIGIARAFLGSGARSVLVALWALEDSATEHLMRCFYEHLVHGESASESLYETMRWMRGNGFTEVSKWAPFMLIGDNVTFDFGK